MDLINENSQEKINEACRYCKSDWRKKRRRRFSTFSSSSS
jgi:hypothetical protein